MADTQEKVEWEEEETLIRWRRRQALEAGMTLGDASRYAEDGADLGELRRLVELGCPPDLLARIL